MHAHGVKNSDKINNVILKINLNRTSWSKGAVARRHSYGIVIEDA